MTSQKKTPPKRNTQLPDWTSEVKPSQDVMALFYAPTGLPKIGPLSPVFPISPDNQQITKPIVAFDEKISTETSQAELPINPIDSKQTNLTPEEALPDNPTIKQGIEHYKNTFETINLTFEKKESTESRLVKTGNSINLQDRDRNDAQIADLKVGLDQIYSENIPYRNPTPCRPDTVSISNTVSDSDTVSKSDIVLNNNANTKLDLSKGFISIPTYLLDELAKTLTPTEWTLYLRLFRLSYGWHKDTCVVGLETLIQSTNIGRTVLRETLKSLQNRNLIQVVETINTRELKGTKYKIYTLSESDTVSKYGTVSNSNTVSSNNTVSVSDTNKYIDDDHDDYLNKDHHQSEHEKTVMMIYKKITNNYWSKADIASYQKIKNIPLESIEMAIKLATQRATNRPNSLAYFVKEIINTANPPKQNRSLRKKIMEKIVDRVRNSLVGSSYSMSDFVYKVKDLCLKEDVNFDNDIFDEIVAKKK